LELCELLMHSSVVSGGGGIGGGTESFEVLFFFLITLTVVGEDSSDTSGDDFGLFFLSTFFFDGLLFVFLDFLLGFSVHEKIDNDVPLFISGELGSDLENLSGKEPCSVSNGFFTLVVAWDGDVNPVEGGVGIAKGNDGDVHVGGFSEALVVKSGVEDNDKSGFLELLSVLIGKGTGNPLSTEVFSIGVGGKLQDSSLGVWSGRDDEDILGVLELDGGDDSGGNHNLLPGLSEVDVVDTLLVSLEDVAFHHFGAVVCSEVDLSGEHADEVLFSVIRVQKSHSVICFRL